MRVWQSYIPFWYVGDEVKVLCVVPAIGIGEPKIDF